MEKIDSGGESNTFKEMEIAFAGRFDFPRKDIQFWRPDPSYMFLIGNIVQVKFSKLDFVCPYFLGLENVLLGCALWDKDRQEHSSLTPVCCTL